MSSCMSVLVYFHIPSKWRFGLEPRLVHVGILVRVTSFRIPRIFHVRIILRDCETDYFLVIANVREGLQWVNRPHRGLIGKDLTSGS